jgi:hypothetical protein
MRLNIRMEGRNFKVKIRRKKLAKTAAVAPGSGEIERNGSQSSADSLSLVTWERQPSLLAECFRATLMSILYTGHNGDHPQILVITSLGPREGKTTVVSKLASIPSLLPFTAVLLAIGLWRAREPRRTTLHSRMLRMPRGEAEASGRVLKASR